MAVHKSLTLDSISGILYDSSGMHEEAKPCTLTLSQKLRQLLRDVNRAAFARRAGVSKQHLHLILKGGVTPRASTVGQLARALGVSLDWLLDDSAAMPPRWTDEWRGLPRDNETRAARRTRAA